MERVLRLSRIGRPIHWPYTLVDWLRFWRLLLLFAFLIAAFIATLPKAFSQTNAFYATIDSPGSDNEQSALVTNPQQFPATQVHEETFNELTSGLQKNGFNFAGSAAIGSYSAALIVKADQYGGAGGTGNYMTVNTSLKVLRPQPWRSFNRSAISVCGGQRATRIMCSNSILEIRYCKPSKRVM